MRTPLLALVLLVTTALTTLPAVADDGGVPHLNQLSISQLSAVAAGTTPLADVALTYAYQNQWGLREVWQIQGTTLYLWKSVHTAAYHDMARAKLAGGGSLSALDSTIFELPYGDYEQYFTATLSAAQVRGLIGQLATDRFPEAPARVGCGEKHWEIALDIAGKRTHVFDVNAPGNPVFAPCVEEVQDLFRSVEGNMTQISQQQFATAYIDLITVSSASGN